MSAAPAELARPTTTAPQVEDLLLARLLPPTKNPPGPKKVRDDLAKLFRSRPADAEWHQLVEGLRRDGFLESGPFRLTDAGRARAMAYLGITELPKRCDWGTIQARYLLPRALGLDHDVDGARTRIATADGLAAALLRRRVGLPVGTGPTLANVLDALACKELNFPNLTDLKEVKAAVLSRLAGSPERLSLKELATQLPRVVLGTPRGGLAAFRQVALADWAGRPARAETPKAEFDLAAFANTVKAAARDCPTGWFGNNKVFINHLWRHLHGEPAFAKLDLPAFKQHLIEANRDDLLTLSRADLVQLMAATDVGESETVYENAVFHFVLVERAQP